MFFQTNFLLFVFAIVNCNPVTNNNDDEWKSYVEIIKSYINNEVNPCDNFYEYACGNYENVVSERVAKKGVQEQIKDEIDEKIAKTFEEEENKEEVIQKQKSNNAEENKNDFSVIKDQVNEAKTFYKSCIKSEVSKLKKSEEYLNYIKNELGGWPAIENDWTSENYDWFKVNVKINSFGSGPFLAVDIVRASFSDFYRRYFGLEKQRDFNETHDLYQYNMKMMLKILKIYDIPDDKAEIIAKEIMDFGYLYDQDHKQSKCYLYDANSHYIKRAMSERIDDLKQMYDFVPEALNREFEMVWNGKLCIDNLYNFIKTADMRIVANYMAIYFLYLVHKTELTSALKDSKLICARRTRELFTPIPELMFANSKYYDSQIEVDVLDYIKYITVSYEDMLKQRGETWLYHTAKATAIEKYEHLKLLIGRQSNSVDYQYLKSKFTFTKFNITLKSYHENNINLMLFKKSEDSKIYYGNDPTFVSIDACGYYVAENNSLKLPVSVFQKPMFSKNFPKAYNYGTLGGYVIAHEFGHALDPLGQKYNEYGKSSRWFGTNDYNIFFGAAACFREHFQNYVDQFENKKLQKLFTGRRINENIIDSDSLRNGFNAYKIWLKNTKNMTSEFIPELNMTGDQLYFLSYAQINCKKQTEADLLMLLQDLNEHRSPAEYRVLSSIANSEDFSKEFKCPKGSKMNPETKCILF